jgi:hypothetical protein
MTTFVWPKPPSGSTLQNLHCLSHSYSFISTPRPYLSLWCRSARMTFEHYVWYLLIYILCSFVFMWLLLLKIMFGKFINIVVYSQTIYSLLDIILFCMYIIIYLWMLFLVAFGHFWAFLEKNDQLVNEYKFLVQRRHICSIARHFCKVVFISLY